MPRSLDHVPDLPALARRLRLRREEVGLSQRQLAFPGCTAAYISRLEAGARMPSRQMIDALAERLGTSREWLETGVGCPQYVVVSVPAAEINEELARAGAPTWASLSDDEREQVLAAMRAAAVSAAGAMATVVAVNRQLRLEALARLDSDLGDRLRAAASEHAGGEVSAC